MSIVRNTVVLRNAALGALVVLALVECTGFVAVGFGTKGVFCKENRSNTLRTSRVHGPRSCTRHVHGRLHGPTRPVRPVHCRVHEPIRPNTAVYTTRYTAVYGRVDGRFRTCRWPVHGRVTQPCTRPLYT